MQQNPVTTRREELRRKAEVLAAVTRDETHFAELYNAAHGGNTEQLRSALTAALEPRPPRQPSRELCFWICQEVQTGFVTECVWTHNGEPVHAPYTIGEPTLYASDAAAEMLFKTLVGIGAITCRLRPDRPASGSSGGCSLECFTFEPEPPR